MTTNVLEQPTATDHATVSIKSLYYTCKVRAKLDPERVKFIEEQIMHHDPCVKPILVAETPENPAGRYGIIAGRHRHAAYLNLGYETVPVVVSREQDPVEWMRLAAVENLDGCPQLPLNMDDINQVVRNFVEKDKSDTWIRTALKDYLPLKTIVKAIAWARSNRTKGLIRKAANFRDEQDCSYAVAAKKFDVSEEALKDFVGKTKHVGLHINAELAKDLSNLNQTYGNGLAKFFVRVSDAYREGQIQEEEARGYQQRVSDYRRRIEAQCVTFLQRLDAEN
jgi:hypothetical protein